MDFLILYLWHFVAIGGVILLYIIYSLDNIVLEDDNKFVECVYYNKNCENHLIKKVSIYKRTKKVASVFRKQRTEITWTVIIDKNKFKDGKAEIIKRLS